MTNVVYMKSKSCPVRIYRSADRSLLAEKEGQQYERVKLVRTFPFSFPDQFISVRSGMGEEIVLLSDLTLLDEDSLRVAQEELCRHYMVPLIQRIESIRKHNVEWIWHVDTDYGKTTIVMDNLHENVHAIAPDRWVITDLEGRRFQLSELELMDVDSQCCWNNIN